MDRIDRIDSIAQMDETDCRLDRLYRIDHV